MTTRRRVIGALAAAGLAGCLGGNGNGSDDASRTPAPPGTPTPAAEYWYPRPSATGNRTLAASGDLRTAGTVRFDPGTTPQWLVAHPADRGSRWTVVAGDGTASQWHVVDGEASRERRYDPLPAGTPPVVAATDGGSGLLRPPSGMAPRSMPAVVTGGDGLTTLYLADNGDLVVAGDSVTRLAVDGLPDGRIVAVGDGNYALYADATDRYTHGALGDTTEGSTLVVVDPDAASVVATARVGPPETFEGLGPLVADLDGDGDPEIVTTVADSTEGARIAVFDARGERVATGPVHEPGWRHQLTVAPLGPEGRAELAVVRKPHVDRTLELYRLEGGSLSVTGTLPGVSTHAYGSRVTDGALAGDLDADGTTELLLPTAPRDELVTVRHGTGAPRTAWRWSLPGRVRTNLTGIPTETGVAVGVGTRAGVHVRQG
jgi:hypothetical protein